MREGGKKASSRLGWTGPGLALDLKFVWEYFWWRRRRMRSMEEKKL
jgi:hypothetical protein